MNAIDDVIEYSNYNDVLAEAIKRHKMNECKWIVTEDGCECSVCGHCTYEYKPNFCSNCGADMQKSNQE